MIVNQKGKENTLHLNINIYDYCWSIGFWFDLKEMGNNYGKI